MSSETTASRVLAARADGAIYQPELELLWFRAGDRFNVVDLGGHGSAPVTVARGMPEVDRFTIARDGALAETEDGCDLAWVALDWSETPKLEVFLDSAPHLRVENTDWLNAELARPLRPVGKRQEFSTARIRLPKKHWACEDTSACGTTVAFGARGLDLVLVLERAGGDCIQRACLLHDPRTHRFATPPKADKWGRLKGTAIGPCGPFMFDRAQTSFLVGTQLCAAEAGCRDIGGSALGWLEPGDTVGAPGLGNFDG